MNKTESGEGKYPDEFVDSSVKLTKKWALQYISTAFAKSEQSESWKLDSRRKRFQAARKIEGGTSSVEDLKKLAAQQEDFTHVKLNYNVTTPTSKILGQAIETVYNQDYKPQCAPVDSISVSKASNRRNIILSKMKMEELRQEMEANGVKNLIPIQPDDLPKNTVELDIKMQMNSKIGESIANEYLISQGFKQNHMADLEKQFAKDLVNCRIAGGRVYFDKDKNLRIATVDPANLISSFVNKPDFSDAGHMGEYMQFQISELREMIGDEYPEKDLRWIAENVTNGVSGRRYSDMKMYESTDLDPSEYNSKLVDVIHIQVRTFDKTTYIKKKKRNGGFRVEKRSIDYKPKEGDKREVIHSGAQAIYEGYWVVGTDYVFQWRKKTEAFRERLNGKWFDTVMFDYVMYSPDMYEMINQSLTEKCKYHDDQMKLLKLKMQQYLILSHPPGFAYDINGLMSAVDQMGLDDKTPLGVVSLKAETGSYFYSSKDIDDKTILNQQPIQPVASGVDDGIMRLAELYRQELIDLKEAVGISAGIDGTSVDAKTLVGALQIQQEGHKAALSNLMSAQRYIIREIAKRVSIAFQTQIRNGENLKEIEDSIGTLNIEEIKAADVSRADFDIDIEMLPTALDLKEMKVRLDEMVIAGMLAPEDSYTVLRTAKESMTNAEVLLSFLSKRFREQEQANKQALIQQQNEGLAQVNQAHEAAKVETINAEALAQIEVEKAKSAEKIRQIEAEYEEKSKLESLENENRLKNIEKLTDEKIREAKVLQGILPDEKEEVGYNPEEDSIPHEAGAIERATF